MHSRLHSSFEQFVESVASPPSTPLLSPRLTSRASTIDEVAPRKHEKSQLPKIFYVTFASSISPRRTYIGVNNRDFQFQNHYNDTWKLIDINFGLVKYLVVLNFKWVLDRALTDCLVVNARTSVADTRGYTSFMQASGPCLLLQH